MRRSSGQPYSGRSLTRVGAFLIVVSLLASSLAAWELHAAANEDARASAHTIGVLVSEQTQDALQAIDLSLREIQRAIAATNYDGYVGQEFSPVKDASISLEMAYRICDV